MPESQALVTGTVLPAVERQGWWEGELAFRHFGTGEGIAVLYNIFPVRDDAGRFVGYATVTRDLRERKRAEEAQDLLIKELSHRIKNIFAVVGGIAGLSARTDPAARPFVVGLPRAPRRPGAGARIRPSAFARQRPRGEGPDAVRPDAPDHGGLRAGRARADRHRRATTSPWASAPPRRSR